jgi:hypothetical protein
MGGSRFDTARNCTTSAWEQSTAARGVIMLVHDLDVRVISEDSELLRHFTLDPSREYQPQRIVSSVYDAPTHPATMRRHITAFRGEGLGNHLTRGTNLNVQVVDRVL